MTLTKYLEMRLKTDEYVEECWENGREYLKSVRTGTIKTNLYLKQACERFERDLENPKLLFDEDRIERVFKFFSFLNVDKNNLYRQFSLLPYQAFIVIALFGFYWKETGKRKYRYAFLFMSRKNGKTTFASALQLYGLIGDGVINPQSLLIASSREQAQIALNYITSMVRHSPALSKRLEAQRYMIRPRDKNNAAFCKTLASNANRLDGYNASMAILDEIHSWPDDSLFNVMKSSILARENPLIFLISTAGFSLNSFCYDYVEYCKNILSQKIEDEATFALLYMLDDGDDYEDSANWIKSNPSLGELIDLEDLVIEFEQAKHRGTQLSNFLTKHLNIFVESEQAWIPESKIQMVTLDFDPDDLIGCECYAGLDLSSTKDLTSLVLLFRHNKTFKVIPYFFMPKNSERLLRAGGIDLRKWIESEYIIECQTETIDYELIKETIYDLSKKYSIQAIYYDKFNSALIVPKLQEAGIYCRTFAQTAMNFNEPLKYLEKVIYDEDIMLGNNPAMTWNMRNVVLYIDGNGNIKIVKNKSKDSVDGVVSLGMAMAGFIEYHKYDYDD